MSGGATAGTARRSPGSAVGAPKAVAAPATPDRLAVPFCIAWSLLLAALSYAAIRREGAWDQVPAWDSSWYHTIALEMKRAFADRGLVGFAEAWVGFSEIHAPLVPALSALSMLLLGESRWAAELVLPVATVFFLLGSFRVTERLFGRKTAWASTLLVSSFPLCLGLSRFYLFEWVTASLYALAGWALLSTEILARWKPTLLFGLLAGLVSLSRMGSPVLLVGPALVMALLALRQPAAPARLLRLATATAIAMALAATWYWPNREAIVAYVARVTYGSASAYYAGDAGSFSLENFFYYLHWNVLEGPGVPTVTIVLLGLAAGAWKTRGRVLRSGPMGALLFVWGLGFLFLFTATQRVGARYFVPLVPIVAIATVRAIAAIPWRLPRRAAAAVVAGFAIFHLTASTLFFPVPHDSALGGQGAIGGFALWNHRTPFLELASSVGLQSPRADFRIPEIVDRLESLGIGSKAYVYVMADHPFFEVNPLRHEAILRRLDWTFAMVPPLRDHRSPEWNETVRRELGGATALVVRSGGASHASAGDLGDLLPELLDPVLRPFEAAGEPFYLGDGSMARVLLRVPAARAVSALPAGFERRSARFFDEKETRFELLGTRVEDAEDATALTLALATDRFPLESPGGFVHVLLGSEGETINSGREVAPLPLDPARTPRKGPWILLFRVVLPGVPNAELRREGGRVGFGILQPQENGGSRRLKVESDAAVDDNGTRVIVGTIAPSG